MVVHATFDRDGRRTDAFLPLVVANVGAFDAKFVGGDEVVERRRFRFRMRSTRWVRALCERVVGQAGLSSSGFADPRPTMMAFDNP
jgi:hypothetical protein